MLSIVTCSHRPDRLAAFHHHLRPLLADIPHELIAITDATGLCEGYTRALHRSSGNLLLFCHDDIRFLSPNPFPNLLRHMQSFDLLGVAGTSRLLGPHWGLARPDFLFGQVAHPGKISPFEVAIYNAPARIIPNIQALDGLFLCFRRACIQSIGWDAATFPGFHLYDLDASYRAYLAGCKLAVACDIPLLHHSAGAYDDRWEHAGAAFIRKHRTSPVLKQPYLVPCGGVAVHTPEEALEVMTPPYWPAEPIVSPERTAVPC